VCPEEDEGGDEDDDEDGVFVSVDPPEPKLRNGPASPDLNYIYLSTMRTRLRAQRTLRRREVGPLVARRGRTAYIHI